MFDYIVDVPDTMCPICGHLLTGWQSKDFHCELDNVPFDLVNNFYTMCNNCDTWVDFTREWEPKPPYPKANPEKIHEYEMTFETKEQRNEKYGRG